MDGHGGWGPEAISFQAILFKDRLLCQEDLNGIGRIGGGLLLAQPAPILHQKVSLVVWMGYGEVTILKTLSGITTLRSDTTEKEGETPLPTCRR